MYVHVAEMHLFQRVLRNMFFQFLPILRSAVPYRILNMFQVGPDREQASENDKTTNDHGSDRKDGDQFVGRSEVLQFENEASFKNNIKSRCTSSRLCRP